MAAVVGLTPALRAGAAWARRHTRRIAGVAAVLVVVGVTAVALVAGHDASEGQPATTGGPQLPDRLERSARPADLERSDERGAVAAAIYVLELEPYGLRSGDWHEFARLCSTQSGWCRDKAASMRGVTAGAVRYDGCDARAEAVRTTPTDAPDTFVVTVAHRQAACVRHALAPTPATTATAAGAGPTTAAGPAAGTDDAAASDVYGGNDDPGALPDLLDLTVRHGTAGWQVVRASLA
ncbi:hypothetical protein ACFT5B_03245 [Luteimicrobium sp. NPDC057192]|uniref:hypothetical protein n=1 Tax=Luteimicrobium sp. NPDC057192 TaxID=3346042 RepID=UPI003625E46A